MTSNPPISVSSTSPFPPCPKQPNGSASTSTSSPLLSKVLAPAATRPNGLPKGGLLDKEANGISRTNSPDIFGSRSSSNNLPPSSPSSLTTPFFQDPLHPSTSSPNPLPPPMPFFGGTIVFLPSIPKPHVHAQPLILPSIPSAPPSPSSSLPPHLSNPLDLKCHARARIPTPHGHVFLHLYKTNQDAKEHLAIVFDPVQMEERKEGRDHIRSRSLDSVWREGETEMERLIRGAYVGRLGLDGGKASRPTGSRTTTDALSSSSSTSNSDLTPPPPPPTPLVRIHSECFTGETLGSQRCDCGEQLDESLRLISLPTLSDPLDPHSPLVPGRGVIVYLRQEGRGIGLLSKLLAYNLQDLGHDTVEANLALGHGADERKWDVAGGILEDLGFGKDGGEGLRLMTNNPGKVDGLRGEGINVVERVGMVPRAWETYPHRHHHSDEEEVGYDASAGGVGPLSLALEGQLHPEVKVEEAAREKERREWMARRGGVGMIGGGETRSEELDRYLKTKVERMGHILELPKD